MMIFKKLSEKELQKISGGVGIQKCSLRFSSREYLNKITKWIKHH
ncbi:bacteriocin [Latilactobacillus sakei]